MNSDSRLIFEAYKNKLVSEDMPYPTFAKLSKHASPKSSKEKDETDKDIHDLAKPSSKEHYKDEEEQRRLDPKCWSGYHKQGTKMKGGVRVNNCVKNQDENQKVDNIDAYQTKEMEQEETPGDIRNIANTLLEISHKMWKGMDIDSFYSAKELELIKSHAESILRRVKNVAEEKGKVTSVSHNGYREILKSFK
jgi:hypothetical protein